MALPLALIIIIFVSAVIVLLLNTLLRKKVHCKSVYWELKWGF